MAKAKNVSKGCEGRKSTPTIPSLERECLGLSKWVGREGDLSMRAEGTVPCFQKVVRTQRKNGCECVSRGTKDVPVPAMGCE